VSHDDPFSGYDDASKTVIRPTPGGRRRHMAAQEKPEAKAFDENDMRESLNSVSGGNDLSACAQTLLSLAAELRNLPFHSEIEALQEQISHEIIRFQQCASRAGCSDKEIKVGSYFICAMIDETVLNTPWGDQSNWGHSSLLVRFHNEAWGGEKFFSILEQMVQRPSNHIDLLELAHLCLSLGFEGKYRVRPTGPRELEQIRQEIFALVQRYKGDPEKELSPNWRGTAARVRPFTRDVPLWVPVVVAGMLLTLVYIGLIYTLSRSSDGLYASLMALASTEGITQTVTAAPSSPEVELRQAKLIDRLRKTLSAEIGLNMVQAREGPILRVMGGFPSGSDQIQKEFRPMLAKIAQELRNEVNYVEVIGHTDSRPIFSARFPSNWDLSNARAKNIADILKASGISEKRINYTGRADQDPIAGNDTAKNRALNRRVDIHIR
jgi:type VI secretion system protein ImpK